MEKILARLKVLMKEQHLSIYKLTELADLSENTIYNWYNKGAEPSVHALQAVCSILGISISQLFAENESEYLSIQENEMLKRFKQLSESKRKVVLNLINELSES